MAEQAWSRRLGWVAVAIVALNWLSKFLVVNRVASHGRVALIDGWVYVVRLRNAGVSFSFLGGHHGWWRTPLLVAVSLLAIGGIVRFSRSVHERGPGLGLALIVAGALGNLGDRLVNGGVTDFLLLRYFPFVFNVADLAITAGSALLVLGLLRSPGTAAAA